MCCCFQGDAGIGGDMGEPGIQGELGESGSRGAAGTPGLMASHLYIIFERNILSSFSFPVQR